MFEDSDDSIYRLNPPPRKKYKSVVKSRQLRRRFQNYLDDALAAETSAEPSAEPPAETPVSHVNSHQTTPFMGIEYAPSDDDAGDNADDEGETSDDEDQQPLMIDEYNYGAPSPTVLDQLQYSGDDELVYADNDDEPAEDLEQTYDAQQLYESSSEGSNVSPLETTTDDDVHDYNDNDALHGGDDFNGLEADLLDDGEDVDGSTELRRFFQEFFNGGYVTGATANVLLKGLKSLKHQKNVFDSLPKDVRTIRKTPRKVDLEKIGGGSYYHFGLLNGILSHIQDIQPQNIELIINVDGLPLFKSSRTEFWPILGLIRGQSNPFPIGIWSGTGKPSSHNEYLRPFVDEATTLQDHGFSYNGTHFGVKISGFSCDAPARSFITGTKGHTGKHACPKCKTAGIYYSKPGKTRGRETFPDLDSELRTHLSFVNRESPEFHNFTTILEELEIDMIMDIPLDYMHLVCLGVVKKLLSHWLKRETVCHLITKENIAEISRRLVALQGSIPSEFARRPRPLEDLPRFKATEFRQFLLYTGPVILKGVLPQELYDHFMVLHVAIKLLSSSQTCFKYNTFSLKLLRHFVRESAKLYGGHFISFNVHCLIHLPADVRRFGPLDSFSCFPFENCLFKVKKLVRHSQSALVQVVKRLVESSYSSNGPFGLKRVPFFRIAPLLSHPHNDGVLLDGDEHFEEFQIVHFHYWMFSIRHPNCFAILNDDENTVITIENIVVDDDDSIFLVGFAFDNETSFFSHPCDSNKYLTIKHVRNPSPISDKWPIELVKAKAFLLPIFCERPTCEDEENQSFVCYPLHMEDKYF